MIDKKKKYKLGDFNYSLPKKFIAQYPETKRDHSKLMVVHKDSGEIEHRKFHNIVDYMRKNDLLILNNTKVFPARLFATKDRTDAKVEVFLFNPININLEVKINDLSFTIKALNSKIINLPKASTYKFTSRCLFLRPIFFVYEDKIFDVFHG